MDELNFKRKAILAITKSDINRDEKLKTIGIIDSLPITKPVYGEWIKWTEIEEDDTGVTYIPHWKCSICNTEYDPYFANRINHCPNCGADMRGDTE